VEITESCLDAETLAAWVDGGLTAPELARAEAHVAGCQRCQAMVGALARITAAAPVVKAAAAPLRWLTWLAPFAAAAAAVIILVAIPASNLDTRVPTAQLSAPSEPVRPPAPPEPAEQPQTKVPAQGSEAKAPAKQSDAKAPLPAGGTVGALADAQLERAKEARSDAAPPPPASLDKLEARAEPPVTVTGNAPIIAGGSPQAAPAAPVPTAQARAGMAGRGGGAASASALGSMRSSFRQEALVEILSPDPSIRWRLSGANVERSTDGGASWELTRTGVSTRLTAGAAVSPTTIWAVGEAGVVLLSTDGRTWRRVATFPEITNLSAIRARDARSVSITTADGRIFSTTDAGATWMQGPLQGF
jgi:hypothetical protein